MPHHPLARRALAAVLLLALAGCGERIIDLRDPPDPDPIPAPSSPDLTLARLQWAWNHRDPAPLDDLFSADFVFQSAVGDSGAAPPLLFRESELEFSRRLFQTGTATQPPANAVTLELVRPLLVFPDPRPGRMFPWNIEVRTTAHLGVRVPHGDYRISSGARFQLVRGDSAVIPQRLLDRGYRPDSTRWWIQGWIEEVRSPRALPGEQATLFRLKALYLDLPQP